jgi:hypothetical protein
MAYEAMAESFFAAEVRPPVLEFERQDGTHDRVRFNQNTNEFGIISADGFIVTYYRPDPTQHGKRSNLNYFWEQ